MNIAQQTKTCDLCEGRGLLYFGAPDALGTEAEVCEVCGGAGVIAYRRPHSYTRAGVPLYNSDPQLDDETPCRECGGGGVVAERGRS